MKTTQSLKFKIYDQIIDGIVSGEYKGGQILNEQELVKRYNVSKSPVREALTILSSEGILTSIPRYGYQVISFNISNVRSIMEFRSVLEDYVLCKSFHHINDTAMKHLEAVAHRTAESSDLWEHWNLNTEFHLQLAALKLGIPSGIQQMLFSVGIMVMQALVNSYGSTFMAGFNGANKIDSFAFMPVQSFAIAVTTYTGQNIGAKRMDRVKHGTRAALVLSCATCVVIGGVLYPFSGLIMRMFSQDAAVIESGVYYLHSVLPFYVLLAGGFIFNSTLRGAGEMIVPLISSMIGLWLARVPAAYLLAYFFGKEYIYYSYAIGWLFGLIIPYIAYRSGKWKNKSIVKNEGSTMIAG